MDRQTKESKQQDASQAEEGDGHLLGGQRKQSPGSQRAGGTTGCPQEAPAERRQRLPGEGWERRCQPSARARHCGLPGVTLG